MNSLTQPPLNIPSAPGSGLPVCGISWGSVIAGAFVAMSVSLILLFLGSALELSTVSPWSRSSGGVVSFTIRTAIWLIVMQWISAGLGGYLAGRLRPKWKGAHADEIFFRDTSHGFLAWAVATVVTAGLLASAAGSAVSGGMHAVTTVSAGAAAGAAQNADTSFADPTGYYVDSMFRSETPNPAPSAPEMRKETTRILALDLQNGSVPDSDKTYLSRLVAAHTGLNEADAAKRVNDVIADITIAKEKAKQEAETARKAGLDFSLFTFLSLLVGAFIASTAAALGGSHRDDY